MEQDIIAEIQSLLRSNPAKSARDIARHLNVTRQEVNSILYRESQMFISLGNSPPLWSLTSGTFDNRSLAPNNDSNPTFNQLTKDRNHRKPRESIFPSDFKSPRRMIEIDDLSTLILKTASLRDLNGVSLNRNHPTNEKITKAWIKLNISPRFQTRFQKTLNEYFKKNKEVSTEEMFELVPELKRSEITLNYKLLVLLGGYISIESIAQSATCGQLLLDNDYIYLLSLRNDPDIRRLIEDLEILSRRAGGETLDSISTTYGITRERIRQRLRDLSIYGVAISPVEIRNTKKNAVLTKKTSILSRYVIEFPGCTNEEMTAALDFSAAEIRQYLDPKLRRFIAPIRRNGSPTMSETEILDAIKLAGSLEYPLSGPGFDELIDSNLVNCLSRVRIMQIFGSWSNACELAGVESLVPVRSSYDRIWTENDLWEYLMDFLLSPQTSNSVGNYDNWAREKPGDRPSSGTLRNYLGQWSEIMSLALLNLRKNPYHSKFRTLLERHANQL